MPYYFLWRERIFHFCLLQIASSLPMHEFCGWYDNMGSWADVSTVYCAATRPLINKQKSITPTVASHHWLLLSFTAVLSCSCLICWSVHRFAHPSSEVVHAQAPFAVLRSARSDGAWYSQIRCKNPFGSNELQLFRAVGFFSETQEILYSYIISFEAPQLVAREENHTSDVLSKWCNRESCTLRSVWVPKWW